MKHVLRSVDETSRKTLRFSVLDGIYASAMTGFTQDYFAPFLILVGATARHIAMLSALPNLFASLVQLKSADITEHVRSRKRVINTFVLLQALMLLPVALIALVGWREPAFFIGAVVLFTSFGAIANPAWGSLMSDIVPENKRGTYFGWRNKVIGFVTVGGTFVAGLVLQFMKKINVYHGFAMIFAAAFVSRMVSLHYLRLMHEPRMEFKKEHYFSFFDFLSVMGKSNFAKFVLFISLMNFSVNIAAPFFPVLMLKDLHFGYILYAFITLSATLTSYLMIGRWGVIADTVGNLKIIRFTSPLIGIIPLLWVVSRNPVFLFIAQILSGFLWAGFNLCVTNFIYDAVTPAKRTRCIAYFNVLNGLALCCGALAGGFMLRWLPPLFGYKILTLFLLSAALRVAIAVIMPAKLKEVRHVEKVRSDRLFFSVIGMRPLIGVERKTIRY